MRERRRGGSCAEEDVRGSGSGVAAAAQRRPVRPRHRPGGHRVRLRRALARRGHHRRARRAARPLHGHRCHAPQTDGHHGPAARGRLPGARRRGGAPRSPGGTGRGLRRRGGCGGLRPPLGAARARPGGVRVHDVLRRAVPAHGAGPAAPAVCRGRPLPARLLDRPLRGVVLRAPAAPGRTARSAGRPGTRPDDHPPGDPGHRRQRLRPRPGPVALRTALVLGRGRHLVDLCEHRLARRDAGPRLPPDPRHGRRHRPRAARRRPAARCRRPHRGAGRGQRLRDLLHGRRLVHLDDARGDLDGHAAVRVAGSAGRRPAHAASRGDRGGRARRGAGGAPGAARHDPRHHRRLDPAGPALCAPLHRRGRRPPRGLRDRGPRPPRRRPGAPAGQGAAVALPARAPAEPAAGP